MRPKARRESQTKNHKKRNPKAPRLDAGVFKNILGFNSNNNMLYRKLRSQIKERLDQLKIIDRSATGDANWDMLISWVLENPLMAHLELEAGDGNGFEENEEKYREAVHFLCMSCTNVAKV